MTRSPTTRRALSRFLGALLLTRYTQTTIVGGRRWCCVGRHSTRLSEADRLAL